MSRPDFDWLVAWVRQGFAWQLVPYPGGRPPATEALYSRSRVVGVAEDTRDGHLDIMEVIARSREPGGTVEWDALSLLVQWKLLAGEPSPPALASWVDDALAGRTHRRGKRQRPPATARQAVIVDAIHAVAAIVHKIDAKKDPAKAQYYGRNISPEGTGGLENCCAEGGSPIDVVGVALGQYVPVWTNPPKYKTVEDLWGRREHVLSRWDRENPPPRSFGDMGRP